MHEKIFRTSFFAEKTITAEKHQSLVIFQQDGNYLIGDLDVQQVLYKEFADQWIV